MTSSPWLNEETVKLKKAVELHGSDSEAISLLLLLTSCSVQQIRTKINTMNHQVTTKAKYAYYKKSEMSLSRKQSEAKSMLQLTKDNLKSILELKYLHIQVTYLCVPSRTIADLILRKVKQELASLLTNPLTSDECDAFCLADPQLGGPSR